MPFSCKPHKVLKKFNYRLLVIVLLGVELLPGAGAGRADPDGGVYDVHARAGVVTIGPVLQIAPWAPVSSAARQGSPPPVIRDLTKKTFENKYLFICFIRAKQTVNTKKTL